MNPACVLCIEDTPASSINAFLSHSEDGPAASTPGGLYKHIAREAAGSAQIRRIGVIRGPSRTSKGIL